MIHADRVSIMISDLMFTNIEYNITTYVTTL